ncbi:MAG: glycoside hydrolase family 3 N-terminal domain-containing protein [Cyanobacteriota bacterium]|nr:glycoside hydrolase family 3 N-terminal domain-containing protein [Cyanobacteriota bacterium]
MQKSLLPNWQTLSLKQQVAQMVVVRASGHLFDSQIRYPQWEPPNATLQRWLADLQVGGVIVLGGSGAELKERSRQLQNWAKIPLLIAADIEEGTGQRFDGATWFPPPMALSAIENRDRAVALAEQMGTITAREALALGINWILAPVVDVNNNCDNPVINVRAFGETAATVSQLTTAFIRGAQHYPALTTAKHFPGHGDTATDSHLELPAIPHPEARLFEVELPPFQSAIAAGVDSVMSAHLLIPAWDEKRPATLSPDILTGQLRQKLGYEGLIVTDALVMGGVANFTDFRQVCVMAVEAGADILLMPQDPEAAIEAVYEAVGEGRIERARIEASLQRIWKAKEKTLTFRESLSIEAIAQPEARETALEIVRASLKSGGPLPLVRATQGALNLIVADDLLNCNFLGTHTPAVAVPKQLGYELRLIDQQGWIDWDSVPPGTLVQIFSRGNPFRGSIGLRDSIQEGIKNLLRTAKIGGLAIYGNPYVWQWLRPYLPTHLPWSFSYGQMPLAQEAVSQVLLDVRGDRVASGAFI